MENYLKLKDKNVRIYDKRDYIYRYNITFKDRLLYYWLPGLYKIVLNSVILFYFKIIVVLYILYLLGIIEIIR